MEQPTEPHQEVLRELHQVAHEVRAHFFADDQRLGLREVYTLCFNIVKKLRHHFPDVLIMVGDRAQEHGLLLHHWLEVPSREIYLDPAHDELDPFLPVRIGITSDPDFALTYHNGVNSQLSVDDPRDRPEMVYRPRTAWDPERGTE